VKNLVRALALAVALLGDGVNAKPRHLAGGTPIPAAASAAGYTTLSFSTTAFTTANVDWSLTEGAGFQWYSANFFNVTPSLGGSTLNADNSISIEGVTFGTAAQASGSPGYHGIAFGCGAYMEAEIGFQASAVSTALGWPAWWAMSLEHLVGLSGQQWSGQPSGYDHFMEVDTLEYDRPYSTLPNTYGGTLHDWYGIFNSTCSPPANQYCNVATPFTTSTKTVPPGTDWTLYHRVAVLWVPATSLANGTITFYFDDIPMNNPVSYSQFTSQSPPPTSSTPWTFGIIDQQHLTPLLDAGTNTPINVRSVHIWQNSSACNLYNP
jgi:hypothetical protein